MHRLITLTLVCLLLSFVPSLGVSANRSAAERVAFIREHPCPSTGQRHGACPGYVVDHIQPLCAFGPDHRSNMQWQPRAESLRKDADERRECRRLRRDAR